MNKPNFLNLEEVMEMLHLSDMTEQQIATKEKEVEKIYKVVCEAFDVVEEAMLDFNHYCHYEYTDTQSTQLWFDSLVEITLTKSKQELSDAILFFFNQSIKNTTDVKMPIEYADDIPVVNHWTQF